jgi:hypothetical protein
MKNPRVRYTGDILYLERIGINADLRSEIGTLKGKTGDDRGIVEYEFSCPILKREYKEQYDVPMNRLEILK